MRRRVNVAGAVIAAIVLDTAAAEVVTAADADVTTGTIGVAAVDVAATVADADATTATRAFPREQPAYSSAVFAVEG